MVRHEHRARGAAVRPLVGGQAGPERPGQLEAGVDEGHPEHLGAEEVAGEGLAARATGEGVGHGGVAVHHEAAGHEVVEEGLDRGPLAPLRLEARREEGLLVGRLAGLALDRQAGVGERLQARAVHGHEALAADGGQGRAAPLHQQAVAHLDRGVAAARQDHLRIGAEVAREQDELVEGIGCVGEGGPGERRGHGSRGLAVEVLRKAAITSAPRAAKAAMRDSASG